MGTAWTKERLGGANLSGGQLDGAARTFELRWGQVWDGSEEADRKV